MKSTMKWIFGIGAIVSGLALVGLLIFTRFWVSQYNMPFGRGVMHGGYSHSIIRSWTPYSWFILGAFVLLAIFCILLVAIRSKPSTKSSPEEASKPLEICPVCDMKLIEGWKYCPSCGHELAEFE